MFEDLYLPLFRSIKREGMNENLLINSETLVSFARARKHCQDLPLFLLRLGPCCDETQFVKLNF